MKPLQGILSIAVLAASALLAAGPLAGSPARSGAPCVEARTVVLVRHAETLESTETARDPGLSEAGEQRARDLARLLSSAGVTHLFASEFQRTRATLAPLAATRGLEVDVVSAREPEALLARLHDLPSGAVAVVAGHSNTVPGLVAGLGGSIADLVDHATHGRMLRSTEYDRLFVVNLGPPGPPGAAGQGPEDEGATTLELRYGAE